MTIWTDFVKEYANRHNTTYGCALSQYKSGLKQAYQKYKKGQDWFSEDDILEVNDRMSRESRASRNSKQLSLVRNISTEDMKKAREKFLKKKEALTKERDKQTQINEKKPSLTREERIRLSNEALRRRLGRGMLDYSYPVYYVEN